MDNHRESLSPNGVADRNSNSSNSSSISTAFARDLFAQTENRVAQLHAHDLLVAKVAPAPVSDDHNVPVIRFSDNSGARQLPAKAADGEAGPDGDRDIISEYIGDYGWWQFGWTFLLALCQIPSTFHIFAFVFQGANNPFWCAPPDNLDMDEADWEAWKLATAKCGNQHNVTALLQIDKSLGAYSCDWYAFEGPRTVIADWSLVCDRAQLVSVVEMCFLAGAGVGSLCCGWLSDKYGRRHTLMIFVLLQASIGTALAYAESLVLYMCLRTILGFVSMPVMMISFVLVVELVSGTWRTVIGILAVLPVAVSYILMAGIAYMWPDWRTTQLLISVPWFAVLSLWYYVPESPRWLLCNGRIEELAALIRVAARCNRIQLPVNFQKTLQPPAKEVKVAIGELFKGPYLRTSCLMIVAWYTLILLYFGITLHMNDLGGDMYLNTVIAGMLESVSVVLCIWVVLKFGLQRNLVGFMLVAGVGCLLANIIPAGSTAGTISLAMLGKCAMGAGNALIPNFTAQQYPTSMRTLSIGLGNCAAGLALVTVPYLWLLQDVEANLPLTLMGGMGVLGAAAFHLMRTKAAASGGDGIDDVDDAEAAKSGVKRQHIGGGELEETGGGGVGGGGTQNGAFIANE